MKIVADESSVLEAFNNMFLTKYQMNETVYPHEIVDIYPDDIEVDLDNAIDTFNRNSKYGQVYLLEIK